MPRQTKAVKGLILKKLEEMYTDTSTALIFSNPFELLIATILSAQSTDEQVNKVTTKLFQIFPTAQDIAKVEPHELAIHIKSIGLYKNKSKNIVEACRMIISKHNGQVPETIEELVELPGVGRKTANVVLSNVFGKPAIAVDTHVFRVANRLGLAKARDVLKTELDLQKIIPREKWSQAHHWLIWHGRRVCKARNPACDACLLQGLCPSKSI